MMRVFSFIFILIICIHGLGQSDRKAIRDGFAQMIYNPEFKEKKELENLYNKIDPRDTSTIELGNYAKEALNTRLQEEPSKIENYADNFMSLLKFINKWEKEKNNENLIIGYRSIAKGLFDVELYDYSTIYYNRRLKLENYDSTLTSDIYRLAISHYRVGKNLEKVNLIVRQYLPKILEFTEDKDSINYIMNRILLLTNSSENLKNYVIAINQAKENIELAKNLSFHRQIESYIDLAKVEVKAKRNYQNTIKELNSLHNKKSISRDLKEQLIRFYYEEKLYGGLDQLISDYLEEYKVNPDNNYYEIQFIKAKLNYESKTYKKAYKILNEILTKEKHKITKQRLVEVEYLAHQCAEKMGKNKVALYHLQNYTKLNQKLREERIKKRTIRNEIQFYFRTAKNIVEHSSRNRDYRTITLQEDHIKKQQDNIYRANLLKEEAEHELEIRIWINRIIFILVIVALITAFIFVHYWRKNKRLLENILPQTIANRLKRNKIKFKNQKIDLMEGFDNATILFTDFVGFTQIAETLSPKELVAELNEVFNEFDAICKRNNLEKIKTIGDAYMAGGGIPKANTTNPYDAVKAGLEMVKFVEGFNEDRKKLGRPQWEVRIGINSGHVIAGVIGTWKYTYDVWGDAVNLASRMESSGEPGKVNISEDTYQIVKDKYDCTFRGEVKAKNKGVVKMYFVEGLKKA